MSRATLEAFDRALSLEAHNVSVRPDLVWQQLYNRLQWEGPEVAATLASELASRLAPGSTPWLRANHGLPESRALIRTLVGHDGKLQSCGIGPDGVVAAASDTSMTLWDAASGTELATFPGGSCTMSPDGSFVVSTNAEGTLSVWDIATRRVRRKLGVPGAVSPICAIDPGGGVVASWGNGNLGLWDVDTSEQRATSEVGPIGDCVFSPDGASIICAGTGSGSMPPVAVEGIGVHGVEGERCAISPDASFVVTSDSESARLTVREMATGEVRFILSGHRDRGWKHAIGVNGCAVSPDGRLIVSAGRDMTLKVWDTTTGREVSTLRGHTSPVTDCAIGSNGRLVVSASSDGTLKLWDSARFELSNPTFGHDDTILGCGIGGGSLVSRGWDMRLRFWDAVTGVMRRDVELGPTQGFDGCAVSPDGSFAAAQAHGYVVKIFDMQTGQERSTLRGHQDWITACEISADGTFLATVSGDRTLRIWDPASGEQRRELTGQTGYPRNCSISSDGRRIVSTSDDGEFIVWDLEGRADSILLRGEMGSACALSPDGSVLVTASTAGLLTVWDLPSGDKRGSVQAHGPRLVHCAVSPDGSFIVSASVDLDKTLKVWDTETLELRAVFDAETNAIAVTPSSTVIVATCEDRLVRAWDVGNTVELAAIALAGPLTALDLHDSAPRVLVGDAGGNLYLLDLVGIAY